MFFYYLNLLIFFKTFYFNNFYLLTQFHYLTHFFPGEFKKVIDPFLKFKTKSGFFFYLEILLMYFLNLKVKSNLICMTTVIIKPSTIIGSSFKVG